MGYRGHVRGIELLCVMACTQPSQVDPVKQPDPVTKTDPAITPRRPVLGSTTLQGRQLQVSRPVQCG